jgi:hypothetical protein
VSNILYVRDLDDRRARILRDPEEYFSEARKRALEDIQDEVEGAIKERASISEGRRRRDRRLPLHRAAQSFQAYCARMAVSLASVLLCLVALAGLLLLVGGKADVWRSPAVAIGSCLIGVSIGGWLGARRR